MFVKVVKLMLKFGVYLFNFWPMNIQFLHHQMLKRLIFPLNYSALSSKDRHISVGLSLDFILYSTDLYIYIPLLSPHCLIYCILSFKTGYSDSFHLILLFQDNFSSFNF